MDWEAKVRDLRRMVNELEMLAQTLDGRPRMMLGRTSDELKQFTTEIERLLEIEETQHVEQSNLPDWLNVDTSGD
jgi:hypothetical protein